LVALREVAKEAMVHRVLVLLLLISVNAFAQETAVIVHKWDDSVGFYDALTGRRLAKIEVGVKPHEMALSLDRRLAYITNYGVNSYTQTEQGGNTISIVDLAAQRKVGEIRLGEYHRPHGIEMSRSGLLYVTTDFPATLLVIDPVERKIVRRYEVGQELPHMVMLSRDEQKAYTANSGSGTVSVIPLKREVKVKHIEVGGVPMGFALSRNGQRLYVATRTNNTVSVIDTTSDAVIASLNIPGHPVRLGLTPDGKHLIGTLIEAGEAAIIETASHRVVKRFRTGANSEGISLDPAGKFGYISAQGDNKVIKFSLKTWEPVLEIETAARPDPIAIINRSLKAPASRTKK
jgi:YVTN family beta-propeller protein